MDANNQIFIASVSKMIDRARETGSYDMTIPRLYKAFDSYLKWAQSLQSLGDVQYDQTIKSLQSKMTMLRGKFPTELCQYNTTLAICGHVPNISPSTTTAPSGGSDSNTAPTVSGLTIALDQEASYSFKESDFTTDYFDVEGDPPHKVIIYFSTSTGAFKFDNQAISGIFEFYIKDAPKLKYTRPDDEALSTSLNFRVSDYNLSSKYSNLAVINITGAATGNLPATIGDNLIETDAELVTILTLAMFTSDTTAAYYDPEGDLIDAIRVDRLHSTNTGQFYLEGILVTDGTVITREQLIAESFHYIGTNLGIDGFEFSARDEGSQTWIQ